MDKKDELKGLLKEANQDVLDAVREQKESNDEKFAKMQEENAELKARIEAFENRPANKVALEVPGKEDKKVDMIYKGYDLKRQGAILEIADEEVKNNIAKMFIDMIHGKAAMNETTDGQGGYLVPEEYADQVFAFARLSSVALQDADIYETSTDSFHIPAENAGITVSWKAEATALAASDPTFENVNLTPKKLGAYSTASNELLMDSKYDIVSRLTQQYGEAIGQEIDNQVFNGSEFTALIGASGINTADTGGTGPSDIDFALASNAIAQIPSNKLMGAKFYMHRTFLHYFRSKADTAGMPILDVRDGGFNIYGYPVRLVEAMPTDTTGSACVAVFGNLRYYAIARRLGMMSLDVDPYGKFLEYQTRFRSVTRWHGAPVGASGFCQLTI
jgi:HK97 family phage major capsid protein